jgi:N-acyl-D-amino-acid deacylase
MMNYLRPARIAALLLTLTLMACQQQAPEISQAATQTSEPPHFSLIIEDGTVYDGHGGEPFTANVGIKGDRIVKVGEFEGTADQTINAEGLAVAPGFINMLSWATDSLIEDGKSQSDIRQGVTLEVDEGAVQGSAVRYQIRYRMVHAG